MHMQWVSRRFEGRQDPAFWGAEDVDMMFSSSELPSESN
jgi:hypothetical protein